MGRDEKNSPEADVGLEGLFYFNKMSFRKV